MVRHISIFEIFISENSLRTLWDEMVFLKELMRIYHISKHTRATEKKPLKEKSVHLIFN